MTSTANSSGSENPQYTTPNIPISNDVSATPSSNTDSTTSQTSSNYGYYQYNSHYYQQYQQYYQQYYAYAQSMQSVYDQQQKYGTVYYPSVTTNVLPSSTHYLTTQAQNYLTGASDQTNDPDNGFDDEDADDDDDPTIAKPNQPKLSNVLNYRCNEKMGLNPLIYTNIQQSPYFKNNLFQLKTYNEVIDEIFYSVKHLEPWEKGSRKVSGQIGMCGSVRGVGAGGIISTPFCILYKLFTLRLTRKQVLAMIRHKDSPYIRALGFMYIRFTQPSQELWQWFEPYLNDEEKVDPKAGGGSPMTIGQMVRHLLIKLDWFSTLFPRIPRHVQLDIEKKLEKHDEEEFRNLNKSHKNKKKFVDNYDSDDDDFRDRKHRSKNDGRQRRSRSRSVSPSSRYRSKKYDDYKKK